MEDIQKIILDYGVIDYAINIVFALAIFIIGKWAARKITDVILKVARKAKKVDETLIKFFENIIYYILLIVVALSALKQIGVDTTSFFAILGAAGLAIGLALKDSLGNFASGVMLIMFRYFKVGDYVTVGGASGSVEEISIFNTVLRTPDNQILIVPNGSITTDTIINVNAKDKRRVDLVVGIGYDDDIKKAKDVLKSIVNDESRVLQEEANLVAVSELGDSSVNFVVRAWVNTPDYWPVKFDLTEEVKTRFDQEGISIPFPQTDVHVYKQD
ncbi:MAG: mechanosensitive ion channel family protein [Campylobacterota bacterium]